MKVMLNLNPPLWVTSLNSQGTESYISVLCLLLWSQPRLASAFHSSKKGRRWKDYDVPFGDTFREVSGTCLHKRGSVLSLLTKPLKESNDSFSFSFCLGCVFPVFFFFIGTPMGWLCAAVTFTQDTDPTANGQALFSHGCNFMLTAFAGTTAKTLWPAPQKAAAIAFQFSPL